MTDQGKGPIPSTVWFVFAVMVIVAIVSFGMALGMGKKLREQGPERNGNREGYMQVVKPAAEDDAKARAAFEAWMDAPANEPMVSGTDIVSVTETVSASVPVSDVAGIPLDMPVVPNEVQAPTEVPPVAQPAKAEPFPTQTVSPLAVTPQPEQPLWQRNAVRVDAAPGAPMLAIVIDDMGGQMDASRRAVKELPAGVTLSFFPWSRPGIALAADAKADGHEIMIHMPMEALRHKDGVPDPGPDTLRVGMSPDEVDTLLSRNVARLADVAVGVNNHMGSRFTGWEPGMRAVLTVLQREGMMFLDSKTSAPTAVGKATKGLELPVLERDIFLDHVSTPEAVRAELNKAVLQARKRGHALAIGHPLPVTLDVLRDELPRIVSSGIVLVPATMLIR
ncbi:MAG: divergent polysaccharide deacetylase family protein [Blastochloris viridis]|uniref:Divergent polysaccharide deacetylase family protein n=1 Tax=Blastochloris viridis TaxID=1079 RepID=A0A6N4R0M3_BLAVI|nr:MAG: divergent polysaccharide deacetylase family protein [Blastochloris viridis]